MADLNTLQAVTLSDSSPLMRGVVWPVMPVALVQNTPVDVYNKALTGQYLNLQYLRVQNVGTKPIKIQINDQASTEKYNYVLAADTAADAGNGGVLEIPGTWNVTRVSVVCTDAAGSKISLALIVTPLAVRVGNA